MHRVCTGSTGQGHGAQELAHMRKGSTSFERARCGAGAGSAAIKSQPAGHDPQSTLSFPAVATGRGDSYTCHVRESVPLLEWQTARMSKEDVMRAVDRSSSRVFAIELKVGPSFVRV